MSTTATVDVVVIGPNLRATAHAFHVHAAGCADLDRSPTYRAREHQADAKNVRPLASLRDVVIDTYDPGSFDYDPDTDEWESFAVEFKVFPCVTWPAQP
ncbi:hypothetical protein [Nocardia altamirensis]|uniref:hypothetical protein n=1 Tax=Nocardia altamirensis TaxID=472158 RepID=UPI00084055C8|nr:hypothetical protein [Nocardia altamirensis]